MKAYLQVYLDESEEELEAIVAALLTLEDNPRDEEALNEAFRLLHTLKGSSGMMGFENVSEIAHELEDRFETFRTGGQLLDRTTMNVLLESVDYFKAFNAALRREELLHDNGSYLIERLAELDRSAPTARTVTEAVDTPQEGIVSRSTRTLALEGAYRVKVSFQAGLQLADLKARLIVARLSQIGEIVATDPPIDDIQSVDDIPQFAVIVLTEHPPDEVRGIADVDGVAAVEIAGGAIPESIRPASPPAASTLDAAEEFFGDDPSSADAIEAPPVSDVPQSTVATETQSPGPPTADSDAETDSDSAAIDEEEPADPIDADRSNDDPSTILETTRPRVSETVRVDIDRLDRLMNLTGELVVTRARFTQIANKMNPMLRNRSIANRTKDLGERLRLRLQELRKLSSRQDTETDGLARVLNAIQNDVAVLDEQSFVWEEARRNFVQITEAVDQLNRVSDNLQSGVLETRMVQVAPLFNRFRRVIRDLCSERNKRVQLRIEGENTELDKRMIDELGDPLLHLVRNSIDHGLESASERKRLGKPEIGTIRLAATHSGNNVLIRVCDDGAGINVDRIRQRLLDREMVTRDQIAELSEQQIIDYIWHPGFSTAESVTDISGRGVGMDVVRKRIQELNGTIDVDSKPDEGSTFTVRLPLTLAIIRSLLVRFGDGVFSIPIDDVREIVSVPVQEVHAVHGHRTINVRGEFIPVAGMDDVFEWNTTNTRAQDISHPSGKDSASQAINVVVLQNGDKSFGLCVDELLGGTDIVIKSLADNFCNIRGLSGASVMGDGSVCLMLDISAVTELAAERARSRPVPDTLSG